MSLLNLFFSFAIFSNSKLSYLPQQVNELNSSINTNIKKNVSIIKVVKSQKIKKLENSERYLSIGNDTFFEVVQSKKDRIAIFKQLINKYWQQTVFVSNSTPGVYQNAYSLNKYKNRAAIRIAIKKRKKFISKFSKSLLNGQAECFLRLNKEKMSDYPISNYSIKFIWRKGLNIGYPQVFLDKKMNSTKEHVLSILKQNSLPLFLVTNKFHEIVINQPAEDLINNNHRSLFLRFYDWYKDYFMLENRTGRIYEAWFFVNPKDADEYQNSIAMVYNKSFKQNGLQIEATKMNFYYELNRNSSPRMHFRLIPDLEEVGQLLTNRRHRANLIFHPQQLYTKSLFQGQPIYTIAASNFSKVKNLLGSEFYITRDKIQYKPIFFNKKMALKSWDDFKQENNQLKLPNKPILQVYNLEDMLKDLESSYEYAHKNNNLLFIPSQDTYQYMQQLEMDYDNIMSYEVYPFLVSIKLWVKRIMWTLISKRPPNWK